MRGDRFVDRAEKAVLPLLLVAGLGTAACAPKPRITSETIDPSSHCIVVDGLTGVHIIGTNKEGSTDAVNTGECAGIFDPISLQSVGDLAAGAAFDIECIAGPKPVAFNIVFKGLRGQVDLDHNLITQMNSGAFSTIPTC